ncbi:oxidoreductase [Dulcicalothrix desertica PCC 7102]|uniref:Oxidoreductase n=1 Tax=Dulcicalothrix desertica PCC 7102 TaxID=232991 RepID=A0A433V6Z6_9CYAN|nr:glucose 1-dehydrogenase [Dulcicalothrix desertica]RUT01829.1 oxidoreductase [Dulcicalothrix desertica PCC 7102]TWH42982.1 NAD(P)-dependent dehydrogenase (short-subunit alcohol dehydrogenase family) [Dulcicalothrix desertica PCC 7102]
MSQTIIVTGGAQGIGKCASQYLLNQGYNVVIADVDVEAIKECSHEFNQFQEHLLVIKTDTSQEESVKECVENTINKFKHIHALVNNAGISNPNNAPVEDLALEDWHKVIETNLTGYFLMSKYAIPHLRQSKGAIVNIASTRALQSEPNTEAYAASKGAIVALTHALAISLGSDVRVNCISPGWIDVSQWSKASRKQESNIREIDNLQHPAGRVGKPEDIALMIEYLISNAASFITGQNFIIDGGMTKKMIYEE